MKNKICFLLILIFLSTGIYCENIKDYSINFDMQNDFSVIENITIKFDSPVNKELNYMFSGYDISVSDENGKLDYIFDENIIKIFPRNSTELIISFHSNDLVYKNEFLLFFTQFSTEFSIEKLNIEVKLPEGYVVSQTSGITGSDGKRITVKWNFENVKPKEEKTLSIRFEKLEKTDIVFPLVIAFVIIIFFLIRYYKKREHEKFLMGFSEDERKVIEILKEKKEIYQNKIEKDLHFSRAKMTRIVAKLQEKKLIDKKKKGRTNKIIWKS